jgi:hypothetical protein
MKRAYIQKKLSKSTLQLIDVVNGIVNEYAAQGYRMTVRQLYYQLVSRDIVPNTSQSYDRIAAIINDGKMVGLIDWDAIEDRTREFVTRSRWNSGGEILHAISRQYHQDMWANQDNRVFVIIEKEALAGVFADVCNEYDIPLLAARGYPSGTVLHEFAMGPLLASRRERQRCVILHFGDHDPSGIDMTRDLQERLELFTGRNIDLQRIALNMDQIEEKNPPENPAKVTDSRFDQYQQRFGDSSWELDALEPVYLNELVETHAKMYIDPDKWTETLEEIGRVRHRLADLSGEFDKDED